MTILSGSLICGLAAMICFCVTPYFVAILSSVSPGLTVCVSCVGAAGALGATDDDEAAEGLGVVLASWFAPPKNRYGRVKSSAAATSKAMTPIVRRFIVGTPTRRFSVG